MRGSSMPDIAALNERVVLHAIRVAPAGISQTEVMERSGLSRQAVSLITRRLIERGIVQTDGTRSGGRGKPATMLRITPGALLAAGVHLDPAHISLVIVDLRADVLARRLLDPPTDDPAADVARIADALTAMRDGLPGDVLGIGVASPAGLDVEQGIVVNPPWLPGWRDVPLRDLLETAAGLPVVLDKDTNAAITAESWAAGPRGHETLLYIYVGAGIGSAVTEAGRVHRGATTHAGEIGHLPTGLEGPLCTCGRRACLHMFTDVAALLAMARDRGILSDEETPAADGIALLSERAAAGCADAIILLEQHGTALGEALRTLISLHDPHRIIIGGPFWDPIAPHAMPRVIERASREGGSDHGVEIVSSDFGDDVGAIGAASLFLERELSPVGR